MSHHPRLVASLAALAALTLGLKIGIHGLLTAADDTYGAQARAERMLAAHGWSRRGSILLTLDDEIPTAHYAHIGCADELIVATVPLRADAFPLVAQLARDDAHPVFFHDGAASDRPPSSMTILRWKLARALRAMGLPAAYLATPIFAVIAPADCAAARDLPWSDPL